MTQPADPEENHERLAAALATWRHWQPPLSESPRVVRPLPGGLSNSSWLLESDRGPCVVRLNSRRDARFNVDRLREQAVLQALAQEAFAPRVWHCDPVAGLLVTEFVAGDPLPVDAAGDPAVVRRVGRILDRLESLQLPLPRFDYWRHLCHYRDQVLVSHLTIPGPLEQRFREHREALRAFQQAPWQPVPVHHDLLPANLVAGPRGLVLLDWEYAAMGYAGMDRQLWTPGGDPFGAEIAAYSELINGYWHLLSRLP